MAEVQPLRTLRYEPRAVGSLEAVAAPPYDVIDEEMRAELSARSPFNVVEVDLPDAPGGGDPYLHAQTTFEAWRQQGVLVRPLGDVIVVMPPLAIDAFWLDRLGNVLYNTIAMIEEQAER